MIINDNKSSSSKSQTFTHLKQQAQTKTESMQIRKLCFNLFVSIHDQKNLLVFRYTCIMINLREKRGIHTCRRVGCFKVDAATQATYGAQPLHATGGQTSRERRRSREVEMRQKTHGRGWGWSYFYPCWQSTRTRRARVFFWVFFTYILIQHLRTAWLAGSHYGSHCPF